MVTAVAQFAGTGPVTPALYDNGPPWLAQLHYYLKFGGLKVSIAHVRRISCGDTARASSFAGRRPLTRFATARYAPGFFVLDIRGHRHLTRCCCGDSIKRRHHHLASMAYWHG